MDTAASGNHIQFCRRRPDVWDLAERSSHHCHIPAAKAAREREIVLKNWKPSRSNSPIVEKAEQRLRQGVRWGENMPIHLRTGTSAAEHNLRKSWPFAPKPRAFRRLHEVFADHSVFS